jgi:hypothetical protein
MPRSSTPPHAIPADPALIRSLAKFWPHREHESSAIKNMFCCIGLHRWRQLDLSQLYPAREIRYCFWCPKIEVDGVYYHP